MKYFLIFFVVIFFCSSAVADACEASFSNGEADRPAFLRRASEKLERDLQAIKNSPEESGLKSKGFKFAYYAGVDLAREFNRVRRYLQEIKADPKRTHIPYFADQIKKTITDFENSFRQHNQDKPEFLRERLKILKALKAEVRKRIGDQNVTYDWWATFNLRLVIIASESNVIHGILTARITSPVIREEKGIEIDYNKKLVQVIEEVMGSYPKGKKKLELFQKLQAEFKQLNPEEILFKGIYTSQRLESFLLWLTNSDYYTYRNNALDKVAEEKGLNNIDILKTHEAVQELLSDTNRAPNITITSREALKFISVLESFIQIRENFPEEMMFFTTDELGIMAFNKLEDNSYFIGISGSPLIIDGRKHTALQFFSHDMGGHITRGLQIFTEKILKRISNISSISDREKAELALFMYRHDYSSSSFRELKDYYKQRGFVSTFLPVQLRADTRKAAREMMIGDRDRFFRSNDLSTMLPDSVNMNSRSEVIRYLNESADVFSDILLAL